MRHTVVIVTTSYPRFPGDSVGTFMEPIAKAIAARGHEVHVVAPWHPLITRGAEEAGVRFHFYRYAPMRSLNVFGYASAMRADVRLRGAAYAAAPLALAAGCLAARRVARRRRATIMHGHWVVPGGVTAAIAAPGLPLVISLHGSDVYVAETLAPARVAARWALGRAGFVTACSDDLGPPRRRTRCGSGPDRDRALRRGRGAFQAGCRGAHAATERTRGRARGRPRRRRRPPRPEEGIRIPDRRAAGDSRSKAGDRRRRHLEAELRERARIGGVADRICFLGNQTQDQVAEYLAAADAVVVPSVRDDSGNVDGLPNVVMEALASGTPLVTTAAGGIGTVVRDGETALVVAERDAPGLARALGRLFADPVGSGAMGARARAMVERDFGWDRTAERFEDAYSRALAFKSLSD